MKLKKIDYSLYLVTDRGLARDRSTLDIVKGAVQGGVTCVYTHYRGADACHALG